MSREQAGLTKRSRRRIHRSGVKRRLAFIFWGGRYFPRCHQPPGHRTAPDTGTTLFIDGGMTLDPGFDTGG